MIVKREPVKAQAVFDAVMEGDERPFKFFTLEGTCNKCKSSGYSLIYLEFIENKKNKSQSIFRTVCISCGDKSMLYSRDITIISTGEPPGEPNGYPKVTPRT